MKHIVSTPSDLPYKLVNYGVDTLVVNVRYADPSGAPLKDDGAHLPEHLITVLNYWQEKAREEEKPVLLPISFNDARLQMYPHGAGKGRWRWLLTCPSFTLVISRGKLNGVIAQVRFSSEYLWSHEWADDHTQDIWQAITPVKTLLLALFGPPSGRLHLQVSELHLCADIAGWDVAACDWQHHFLSRARTRTEHPETVAGGPGTVVYTGRKLATLNFGGHGSALSCCIYNKSLEIRTSLKLWFQDIWRRHGWDGSSEVWRVEYRWRRDALHEVKLGDEFHGVEDIADLDPDLLVLLWSYGAGHTQCGADGLPDGWLRFAQPSDDTNMARWPVHPAWAVVQSAFTTTTERAVNISTGEVVDIPASPLATLVRQRHYEINVRQLAQQVGGCMSTLAAWLGGLSGAGPIDDLPSVFEWLYDHLPAYALPDLAKVMPLVHLQAEYEVQFEQAITEKRSLYGVPAPAASH